MSNTTLRKIDFSFLRAVELTAVLLIAMMGAAVTTLMPLLVGAYSDSGSFTSVQVGWLTSADVAGILLASTSAYVWSRRVNWRLVTLISLSVFILCNYLSTITSEFEPLLLVRFFAGVACGCAYALSLCALGDHKNTDKAFGALVTIQVLFGTIGFWLLPEITAQQGFSGIFHFFNLCLIPALILSALTYPSNSKTQSHTVMSIDGSYYAAALIFFGVVAYYFAQGTVWAYLERIGVVANLSGVEIGQILAVGFALSALGSLLSGKCVAMFGRNAGLWATAVIQLPCLLLLYNMDSQHAFWIYAITTIIYQVMWSFVVPIMMAIFNDIDKSGKLIALCIAAFKVGLVVGPPVAAVVVSIGHINDVIWLGGIAIVVSIVLCIVANNHLKQRISSHNVSA